MSERLSFDDFLRMLDNPDIPDSEFAKFLDKSSSRGGFNISFDVNPEQVEAVFSKAKLPYSFAYQLRLLPQKDQKNDTKAKWFNTPAPKTIDDPQADIYHAMSYLIAEAIYCLHKVIDYCQTYSISYMNTHSLIGSTYAKLATWAARHQAMVQFNNYNFDQQDENHEVGLTRIKEAANMIEQRVSDTDRLSLRYNYNSEMALHHYWYAKELHNEGMSYREQLESMYYLNDDFNDNRFHFNAAIERYWINSGVIDARIEKLKERVTNSTLYDIKNYDN